MKKILVVTYSQSGQLDEIVANVISDFGTDVQVTYEKIVPVPVFEFPWNGISFYDVMPECVEMILGEIKPVGFNPDGDYDLIILGYPIWFLSPPIPITTFLQSEDAKKVMSGKPVVTVLGTRNMWVMAQEEIKKMISNIGGKLVGNIVLTDTHNNFASVITISYWMSTGKKDRYLGIFPKPGVRKEDIEAASRFSPIIYKALVDNDFCGLQNELLKQGSVILDANVVSTEMKGKKIFKIWSKIILKKGHRGDAKRRPLLHIFKWYLLLAIFLVSPLVSLAFYLSWPLFYKQRKARLKYYREIKLNNGN